MEPSYSDYQMIVAVDCSGSMTKSMGKEYDNVSRYEFVRRQLADLAEDLIKYDKDGLDLITFSSNVIVHRGINSKKKVNAIFKKVHANGTTNTTGAVSKAWSLHQEYKKKGDSKGTIVVIITDGEPNSKVGLKNKLIDLSKKVDHHKEIGFQFLQVGKNKKAKDYLETLDNLKVQNDIVDRQSFENYGGKLSVEKIIDKAINS